MNWKLILKLSAFGLVMGIATVFVIPSSVEPLCWLAVFTISAAIISKRARRLYFIHGLLVSVVNSVWVTGAHVLFFGAYSARHVSEIALMSTTLPVSGSPRLQMILIFPIVGIGSGLILGLFSYAAHLLRLNFGEVRRKKPAGNRRSGRKQPQS